MSSIEEGFLTIMLDEDAEILWVKNTDINPEQILRFDKNDNFWEMGEVGPCGPCSELHIDLGEGTCPLEEPECIPSLRTSTLRVPPINPLRDVVVHNLS